MNDLYFNFVQQFFTSYECPIIEKSNHHLKIQLTDQMDEEIMNRPFYWHYMKKMNRQGAPMQLTFTHTNQSRDGGIYLHAGTPKLHTLYKKAMEKGKTTRLYEAIETPLHNRAMTPWLLMNISLHFRGKQTKDELLSVGLNLIHGTLVKGMMERIWDYDFETTVSDYSFPMTPVIGLNSAHKRIEKYVEEYAATIDDQWIRDSLNQLTEEKNLLNSFYESEDISLDLFTQETEQIDTRYRPRINMEIVNGGLFYLSQETSKKVLNQETSR